MTRWWQQLWRPVSEEQSPSSSHAEEDGLWQAVMQRLPILEGLDEPSLARLERRARHQLHDWKLTSAEPLDAVEALALATQAMLLLNGWPEAERWRDAGARVHEIMLPAQAVTREVEEIDDAGVVHIFQDTRAGETWYQGPVVISQEELAASGDWSGFNVVIHEFAHKLDMANATDADGFPPLRAGITPDEWHTTFTAVWDDLNARLERGEITPIDEYAASHPAECFAVCCEYFFTASDTLEVAYPELYALLERFFCQSTLKRSVPH
ncbi:zinc-dependent peptidase [Cobetia crustatorum]|uniref:Zinc-dependent peptidase n=1 Tax=Cobetia crustatorum TaxID=553385 RepID=A0A558HF97_9GAMM|nr:M90 family metallopeptidase [Cobetia crustatorum]TVU67809.1 zinc-dependent peptidase [Cobetia crustatorum]